ncbi:MAG: hypothetical protein FJZ01_15620 [Candidatus Sericytochromatia bacterium]|nr:hypothetical protein [Candidatus Tanganyikabacteria bacterium]
MAAVSQVAGKRAFKKVARQFKPTFIDRFEGFLGVDRFNRMAKMPTKYRFALDHPELLNNPRITVDSAEFKSLRKALKPGDIILSGNDDSFVHGIVHLGDGDIVHALAQEAPGRARNLFDWLFDGLSKAARWFPLPRKWREGLSMQFKALPRSRQEGLGVVHEKLDTYFARAHRDNAVIMRVKGITPDDVAAMKEYSLAQVGKKYDYGFATFDDVRQYCTELVANALAQIRKAPRIQHAWDGAGPVKREMIRTNEIIKSPDLVPVWKAANYDRTPFGKAHPIKVLAGG